jgi:hypothetical protein
MRKYMRKFIITGMAVAMLAVPGVASADVVSTDFEGFGPGSVDSQDGWHSAVLGDVPALPNGYDQEVKASGGVAGFGTQSLRHSNAISEATGEFEYQTYSKSNVDDAGEALANTEFDSTFQFTSTSINEQPGSKMRISPDNGHGGRMSFVSLTDTPDGIVAQVADTPEADGGFRVLTVPGFYSRDEVHTVRIWMKLVPGADNDIVRIFIDGEDIGNKLGVCLETWENFYRATNQGVPVTNSLGFRADNGGQGNPSFVIPSLVGGGYLFDNVVTTSAAGPGPTAGNCGDKGAFCSPGYWKNAPDSAWEKVAPVTKTSTFNSVVVPNFYATPIENNGVTVGDVLTTKSANKYGKAAGPFGLNPYNAVGAALTSKLPGYVFDPAAVGSLTDTCPLDGNGNWKPGAAPTS